MHLYLGRINVFKTFSSLNLSEIIDDLIFTAGKQPGLYHFL